MQEAQGHGRNRRQARPDDTDSRPAEVHKEPDGHTRGADVPDGEGEHDTGGPTSPVMASPEVDAEPGEDQRGNDGARGDRELARGLRSPRGAR